MFMKELLDNERKLCLFSWPLKNDFINKSKKENSFQEYLPSRDVRFMPQLPFWLTKATNLPDQIWLDRYIYCTGHVTFDPVSILALTTADQKRAHVKRANDCEPATTGRIYISCKYSCSARRIEQTNVVAHLNGIIKQHLTWRWKQAVQPVDVRCVFFPPLASPATRPHANKLPWPKDESGQIFAGYLSLATRVQYHTMGAGDRGISNSARVTFFLFLVWWGGWKDLFDHWTQFFFKRPKRAVGSSSATVQFNEIDVASTQVQKTKKAMNVPTDLGKAEWRRCQPPEKCKIDTGRSVNCTSFQAHGYRTRNVFFCKCVHSRRWVEISNTHHWLS